MSEDLMRQIFDKCDPLVNSGDTVEIVVDQTLKNPNDLLHLEGPSKVTLSIEGPQIAIDPSFISGVFPAPGSEETPDEFLPHVAFSRRTLPWERDGLVAGHPWMALLLVRKSELDNAVWKRRSFSTVQRMQHVGQGGIQPVGPVGPVTIDPGIFLPVGAKGSLENITVANVQSRDSKAHTAFTTKLKLTANQEIFAAFIPNEVMGKIMPHQNEVPLLCHMKRTWKVHPNSGKPMQVEDQAIVIGNRLPDAGPANAEPEEHTALLVSFEGRQDLLEPGRFSDHSKTTALIVLHHWTFTPSGAGDFEELMHAMVLRPNGGVLRFGNLPKSAPPAGLSGGFESVLDTHGFFVDPIEHEQEGDVSFRGPLRPFPAGPRAAGFAIRAAPEEFEDTPGQHDYSHAAAFELGRLLALGDAGILEEMREVHAVPDRLPEKQWVNQLPPALQKPDWVQQGNPQWHSQPWEMPGQQLWKSEQLHQQQFGIADFTGIEMQGAQWKQNVLNPLTSGPATQIEQVFDIDISVVDINVLDTSFGEVIVKGMP